MEARVGELEKNEERLTEIIAGLAHGAKLLNLGKYKDALDIFKLALDEYAELYPSAVPAKGGE